MLIPSEIIASVELPPDNGSMPGEGPVRRADWFLPIWQERRELFLSRKEHDQDALVFLGDSITSALGNDFKNYFPGVKLANRGISGDTTRGMLYRLREDVLSLHPKGVVILAGTNDLEENAEPAVIARNLRRIVDALRSLDARLPIVLSEVFPSSPKNNRPPARIKALNQLYGRIASEDPCLSLAKTWKIFANSEENAREEEFPDLLHPNELGYAKWIGALKPVLKRHRLI